MRNIISAVVIDPLYTEHDYSLVKTEKVYEYDETEFDLKILPNTENIFDELSDFKGYDALITIGNDIDFSPLNNASFEIRKKWTHLFSFNKNEIITNILNTFLYNIGRERDKGEKLFSIFTCAFNTSQENFFKLYSSLKAQTYKNWNWWILDDSTNDNFVKMVSEIKDDRIIVLKNITNHGSIGFNKHVIAMSCDGDYLVEVDHDDELTPDCLEYLDKAFNEYPDSDFVYSDAVELMNGVSVLYGTEESNGTWAYGEGTEREEEVNGKIYRISAQPDITPYSIRSIHMQPNHVRCWKKDFYHKIGGHTQELSVLDDMDILVRTFLNGKMTKIEKVLYIQYEGEGERGVSSDTAQSTRFAEIQRTDQYLKWKYDSEIHKRILELGFEDTAWNDELQTSVLWIEHTPSNKMNYNVF